MTELAARRFRALGDSTRLRILQALEDGEKTVNHIVMLVQSTQPNVSKHLKALCQEGLVYRKRNGVNVFYRIADPMVFKLCDLVCRSATEHARRQLAGLDAASAATRARQRGHAVK